MDSNLINRSTPIKSGGKTVTAVLAPEYYHQREDGAQIKTSDCKFLRKAKHPLEPDGPIQLVIGVPLTPESDKLTEVWFPDNEFTRFYFPVPDEDAAHHTALAETDQTRIG